METIPYELLQYILKLAQNPESNGVCWLWRKNFTNHNKNMLKCGCEKKIDGWHSHTSKTVISLSFYRDKTLKNIKRVYKFNSREIWYGFHPNGKPKYCEIKMHEKTDLLWRWDPLGRVVEYRTPTQYVKWKYDNLNDDGSVANYIKRPRLYRGRTIWVEQDLIGWWIKDKKDDLNYLIKNMNRKKETIIKGVKFGFY